MANPGQFIDYSKRAIESAKKIAGRGLQAGTIWLSGRVKEILSVPAPRRIVRTPTGNKYVATVPATAGAPPRKLSGTLRRTLAWEMRRSNTLGRVGSMLVYSRKLETQNHPYLTLALMKYKSQLIQIIGKGYQEGSNLP